MKSNVDIDKKIIGTYIVSSIVILAVILLSFVYSVGRIDTLEPEYIRDVSVDLTGMVLGGVLIYSLAYDKPWDAQNRSLFRTIFTLCMLFHLDIASSFMEGHAEAADGVLMVNTIIMFAETLLIYCFWAYVREELHINKKTIPVINGICKLALLVDLIIDILNIWFGYFFTVNESGVYLAGKYENTMEITSFVIYVVILYMIGKAKDQSVKERAILLTFQIFSILAHIFGLLRGDYALVYPSYLLSVMLIYINVFATRSSKILEQEAELNKKRAALMVSQIQPHFLYNVLTTISNLCVTDPEEAEETTVLFSQYLRTNLDSLRKTEPVSFSVELEKKRFGDKLNVEVDCPETKFLVPALGLQPIVENSVKHGIRGKDTPGHLKITSRKVAGGVEVEISDDGVGFDMNAPMPEDGRSHVGMVNVKARLEQMCNATVKVESSPGNGCCTTIFFPEMG